MLGKVGQQGSQRVSFRLCFWAISTSGGRRSQLFGITNDSRQKVRSPRASVDAALEGFCTKFCLLIN